MATQPKTGIHTARRGISAWRVATWLLLLLAAFGCVQYAGHAQWLWTIRAQVPASEQAALHGALAWDAAYFVAAFVLIALCAGCILRQAWARVPLRVAVALLALWALVSGGLMASQWLQLERSSADAIAHLASDDRLRMAILHARRSFRIALVLKLAAIPALLWVAWRLGVPGVRAEFHRRRGAE